MLVIPDNDAKLKARKLIQARRAVVSNAVVNVSQSTPKPAQNVAVQGSQGLNGYEYGQCTGWVAGRRYVPAGWGNASSWKQNAINAGWTVSSTPVTGAIAWRWGHVAFVEAVGSGTVTISEQNYDWNSGIRTITIPVSLYEYIY